MQIMQGLFPFRAELYYKKKIQLVINEPMHAILSVYIGGYFRFDTLPWEALTGTLMYKHSETHGILLHPQEALQTPIKSNLMPIGRNWMPIKCTPGMPIRNTMMPIGNTLAHTESLDSLRGNTVGGPWDAIRFPPTLLLTGN